MAGNLFREKSLKRIASPEELDRYIRVSKPGTWLVLSAIIALLAGLCIWGCFGRLETVVSVEGTVENGEMTITLQGTNAEKVEKNMTVYKDREAVGTVEAVDTAGGGIAAKLKITNLADGRYGFTIPVESIHPISFIFQ